MVPHSLHMADLRICGPRGIPVGAHTPASVACLIHHHACAWGCLTAPTNHRLMYEGQWMKKGEFASASGLGFKGPPLLVCCSQKLSNCCCRVNPSCTSAHCTVCRKEAGNITSQANTTTVLSDRGARQAQSLRHSTVEEGQERSDKAAQHRLTTGDTPWQET